MNETVFDLTIAVARLPERQRVVVALLSAGFKLEDCGNVLGISTAAVFYTKSIAIDNLKMTLKGAE
jgi:DNA-directed RNA polymerase specialized sigma subunit